MALRVHLDKVGAATGCTKESLELVADFCTYEGIESVQDLRGFFTTFEAAKERGVTVAQAWACSLQEPAYDMEARRAVVEVAHSKPAGGALAIVLRKVAIKLRRAVAPKKHQMPPEEGQASADRIAAARQAVELSMSWAPGAGLAKGQVNPDIIASRADRCTKRLARFDCRTIRAAVLAWAKYQSWGDSHDIDVRACTENLGEVSDFIEAPVSGTSRTSRVALWHGLMWCRTHLRAPIFVEPGEKPKAPQGEGLHSDLKQAITVEPEVLMRLEVRLQALRKAKDWRATVLACLLIQAYAGVRYCHLQRSEPLVHLGHGGLFKCWMGKKAGAFVWYAPGTTVVGGGVLDYVWAQHQRFLKPGTGKRQFLACHANAGQAVSLAAANAILREITQAWVGEQQQLSSYSLRRVAPTLADALGASWEHRMALGGWKEAAGTQERRNLMPVRYSARRQETEVQAKLQQAVFLQALMEEVVAGNPAPSWDKIASVAGKDALVAEAKAKAEGIIAQVSETPARNMAGVWMTMKQRKRLQVKPREPAIKAQIEEAIRAAKAAHRSGTSASAQGGAAQAAGASGGSGAQAPCP